MSKRNQSGYITIFSNHVDQLLQGEFGGCYLIEKG